MNPYIQVFLAIIIVIILFVGALMVYNKETVDAIRQSGNIKKIVPIFSGIIDFYERNDIVYNTLKFYNINFDKIKVFAVIRNPYDRLISDLFYYKLISQIYISNC